VDGKADRAIRLRREKFEELDRTCNERRSRHLLFVLDTFNKHLIEFEGHPVRKVRETLDQFAKDLLHAGDNPADTERALFRLRQFFSAYRVDETSYFHKTLEDFRTIIWDFVDQLSEILGLSKRKILKFVRAWINSRCGRSQLDRITQEPSRKFIDCYMNNQSRRDKRRSGKMKNIRKNLAVVKKQLGEANNSLRVDHLTGAYNRKTFDEYADQHFKLFAATGSRSA